jgi:photosystem I reaction center subunit XII
MNYVISTCIIVLSRLLLLKFIFVHLIYNLTKKMLSDSQILFALAIAIIPSLLAIRLGTALND